MFSWDVIGAGEQSMGERGWFFRPAFHFYSGGSSSNQLRICGFFASNELGRGI
jgi:hypothetical protein